MIIAIWNSLAILYFIREKISWFDELDKYWEYFHMTDHSDNGTDGFLPPSNTQICRNYAILSQIAEEGIHGTRENMG